MEVSVPKTECMHVDSELVQHYARVTVNKADYQDTGKDGLITKWAHPCTHCPAVFPDKHGLAVHLGRWCGAARRETFEQEFEVDKVLQARGPPQYRFYEVLWAGYSLEEATWEPARHLLDCAAVDAFWVASDRSISDHLPEQLRDHRCRWWCKHYKRNQDRKAHHTRGCDCAPRSKVGGNAEKAVKRAKMQRIHKAADKVVPAGKPLKNSFSFKYLGFEFQADGSWRQAVDVRMALARTRFGKLHHIWGSTQLSLEVKLRLYDSAPLTA